MEDAFGWDDFRLDKRVDIDKELTEPRSLYSRSSLVRSPPVLRASPWQREKTCPQSEMDAPCFSQVGPVDYISSSRTKDQVDGDVNSATEWDDMLAFLGMDEEGVRE